VTPQHKWARSRNRSQATLSRVLSLIFHGLEISFRNVIHIQWFEYIPILTTEALRLGRGYDEEASLLK
jgi:hypothetical protein